MAREAASKEAANITMCRLPACNEALESAVARIGNSALLQNSDWEERATRARSGKDRDSGETSLTMMFQAQTFKTARYC